MFIDLIPDAALDALLDTLKILPFLFLAYLLIEYLEQRAEDKTVSLIHRAGKWGPAIGSALGTFTGQNFGAGRLDRVRTGLRQSAWIAVGTALTITVLMLLFGRQLLALFVEDDPAVVEQVLVYAYRFLCFMAGGLPCLYLLFVYRYTLQGLGDTLIPMISGIVELAMRILCATLLPALVGEWGVYFAEISAWIGAAMLLIAGYYYRMHRLERSAEMQK